MNGNRKSSESVLQYALALRELCFDCEYSAAVQSKILRDVFVKGLNLPSVQTKLMLKDNTLTFDNAYKEVAAKELAAKCSIEFKASSSGYSINVNLMKTLGRKKYSTSKEGTYRSVLSKYPLQASNITLKSYTSDAIPIAGKVYIPVTYGKQRFTLPVMVACSERPALLGRDWLQMIKLDWKSIFSVMSGATFNIHNLMGKYALLFQSDGSTIQGHTETLNIQAA
ncbi:hypothetical protein LSH36_1289g00089 [Paralvinella palmiformis]|uniref:Uncharacterized protein n=1 Tax=Paralvinella palmiformis TaxID=53620 RepID=A0AAD9IU51_9ANNE|nr:hypothetical protein LSH36_1289g00089 [Paralvinella palmiformis]